ncbi:uncharacterized protein LOC131309586 [Rhododendron vialii]|uniref:uncharacterized protein LOC131309586 n=1 Tax=Rhododendron vialii TaxID=182163 RepID=UPI00265E2492|nr:uncharacterized protein LOC131309586 [Rhododendron vialii]
MYVFVREPCHHLVDPEALSPEPSHHLVAVNRSTQVLSSLVSLSLSLSSLTLSSLHLSLNVCLSFWAKTYPRSTQDVPTEYPCRTRRYQKYPFAGMVRKTMSDKALDFVNRVVQPKLTMACFYTLALGVACDISAKRREERLNGYDYEERLNRQAERAKEEGTSDR